MSDRSLVLLNNVLFIGAAITEEFFGTVEPKLQSASVSSKFRGSPSISKRAVRSDEYLINHFSILFELETDPYLLKYFTLLE